MPLTVDRRDVTAPNGNAFVVVSNPMGATSLQPQEWPEPVNYVTTAPGLIGIFEMLRNRVQFRGAWRVDVFSRDASGRGLGCVLTEQAENRYAAADRVAQLADQISAGTFPPLPGPDD